MSPQVLRERSMKPYRGKKKFNKKQRKPKPLSFDPVSYTHLTLPTNREV